jgi:F5/8 type C domain
VTRPLAAALIAAVLLAGCHRAPRGPQTARTGIVRDSYCYDDSVDRMSLLDMAYGGAVVDRTAELTLDNSALRPIDGDYLNEWFSPPGDPYQSLLFALPAMCRITRIGLMTSTDPRNALRRAQIDVSPDGRTFTPLRPIALARRRGYQFVNVEPPVDATYLRVTVLAAGAFASINSLDINGSELAPVAPRRIDGCWIVNAQPAAFTQSGSTARGFIEGEQRTRMYLDGGFDGRVWRFVWIRGPQSGLLALTQPPDSSALSGIGWYEHVEQQNATPSMIGRRIACARVPATSFDVLRTFLDRRGYVPLYGLRFDDRNHLMTAESATALRELTQLIAGTDARMQLVSREIRGTSAEADRAAAQARLDSLRAELERERIDLDHVRFAALGRDDPHAIPCSQIQRRMDSDIELMTTP